MKEFLVIPAIDLRQGQVVRLQQGDPGRQTTYSDDPAAAARRWLDSGAPWLHVVNLDGAFGEADRVNRQALEAILQVAAGYQAQVQFGGGLRSPEAVRRALELGAARVVLGTLAVEQPQVLSTLLQEFGPDHIAVGIDARRGLVKVRGWTEETGITALELSRQMAGLGLQWLIFTDIARDGLGRGLNLQAAVEIAGASGLKLIVSGGVSQQDDILRARDAGLSAVIVGNALYNGSLAIRCWKYSVAD